VRIRVSFLLVLAVGLVACTGGPAQAEAVAIDKATTGARDAAARVRESLEAELRTHPFADAVKSLPTGFAPGAVTVLDSSPDAARVMIVWTGEANSGFYEQAAVRLCVKYTGSRDRVDMTDTECPAGAPTSVNGVQVAQTVTLRR